MAQKLETIFRAKFRKRLETIPNSFWESISQKSIKGTADLIGVVNGWAVWIELKASSTFEPDPLQKYKLQRVAQAGGIGLVANPQNEDEVIDLLIKLPPRKNA